MSFDPYHKWLGIPPHDQPPNHYRLLQIELFEADPDVIDAGAKRQTSHIEQVATGAMGKRIKEEIKAARLCLLNPTAKAVYDDELRERLAAVAEAEASVIAIEQSAEPVGQRAAKSSAANLQKTATTLVSVVLGGVTAFGLAWLIGAFEPRTVIRKPSERSESDAGSDATDVTAGGRRKAGRWIADAGSVRRGGETGQESPPIARQPDLPVRKATRPKPDADGWYVLRPEWATSLAGARLSMQPDGSVLASGPLADVDSYTLSLQELPEKITAFRLEALPDESLPAEGPGRNLSGNFVLTEFTVISQHASIERRVALANASATFEQTKDAINEGYDRYPASAAIDENKRGLRNGWGVYPEVGRPQQVVFETASDLALPEGTRLTVRLDQNWGLQHCLGRFRISATSNPRPIRATPQTSVETQASRSTSSGTAPTQTSKAKPAPSTPLRSSVTRLPAEVIQVRTPTVPTATKAQPPAAAEIDKADKAIAETFEKELAELKKPKRTFLEKQRVAQQLLQTAATSQPAERFALLKTAAEIAAKAGDSQTALACVAALDAAYEIDALKEQAEALEKAGDAANVPVTAELRVIDDSLSLADRALKLENAAVTAQAFRAASSAASHLKDRDLTRGIADRKRDAQKTQTLQTAVQPARGTVKMKPEDAEANLTVGKYECLVLGDWELGLAKLRRGANEAYRKIAELEQSGPETADAYRTLGDAWWEVAEKESTAYEELARREARYWYDLALSAGATKSAEVQKRIAAAEGCSTARYRPGLVSEIYQGHNFENLLATKWDRQLNWQFGNGPATAFTPPDHFSIRCDGALRVPVPGKYVFTLAHDDGARLWIDDKLLIDNYRIGTHSETVTVELDGRLHPFRLEYYEDFAPAHAILMWKRPGSPQSEPVPPGAFWHAPQRFERYLAAVAPGFLFPFEQDRELCLVPSYSGRFCVRTHPLGQGYPAVIRGAVVVPRGRQTELILEANHIEGANWSLIVTGNGQKLHESLIGGGGPQAGWVKVAIDLGRFAGEPVTLEIQNFPNDWRFEFGYWSRIAVESQ